MNIITAEQAREMTDFYIPNGMHNTVDYCMKKIKYAAEHGMNFVEFHNDTTLECHLEIIFSDNFKDYITTLNYRYMKHGTVKNGRFYKWVTISW